MFNDTIGEKLYKFNVILKVKSVRKSQKNGIHIKWLMPSNYYMNINVLPVAYKRFNQDDIVMALSSF